MRKSLFALAVLASLGASAITTSASAAPVVPMAIEVPSALVDVRMNHGHRMGHQGMRRGHHNQGRMMRHGGRHRHNR